MSRKKIPEEIKLKVVASQSHECSYCFKSLETTTDGIPLYDIDHIEMHSLTQNNEIDNLQALCLNCHRVKSVREMRERRKHYKSVSCTDIPLETHIDNRFNKFKFTC